MKTLSPITKMTVTAAAGLLFFTGCTTTQESDYAGANMPQSAISYVPLTDPEELSKWNNQFDVTSIERYQFEAPAEFDLGFEAELDTDPNQTGQFRADMEPGDPFVEAAGGESTRTIWHAPHQR